MESFCRCVTGCAALKNAVWRPSSLCGAGHCAAGSVPHPADWQLQVGPLPDEYLLVAHRFTVHACMNNKLLDDSACCPYSLCC